MGLIANVYRDAPNVCPLNKIQVNRVCIVGARFYGAVPLHDRFE